MEGSIVRSISDKVMYGIKYNGGASVGWSGKTAPDSGFMVGGLVTEEIVKMDEFLRDNVTGFIWLHLTQLTGLWTDKRYVGAWVNRDTGNVHLDISERWSQLENAMAIARTRGELAIWDLGQEEEVRV